jgi:hypothetical protein
MAKKQKVSIVKGILTCEYPGIGKSFSVDLSKYPASIYVACDASDHGMKQKFGDAASGGTAEEKLAEVKAIHASLMDGKWERTSTPDLTPIICEAIARLQKKPLKKVQEAAEKAGADKVKEWGQNAKVKAMVLTIRAERAAKEATESDEEVNIEV